MSSLVEREQANAAMLSPPWMSRSSVNLRATKSSAVSQSAGSNSPVSGFFTSGVVMRSGEFTKSKLPLRPFTHASPTLDGPSAACTSTI